MSWSSGLLPFMRPAAEALVAYGQQLDPAGRVTSAYRSRAEQTRLYRRYLAGLNRYPVAPPGRSLHEQGRAFDFFSTDDAVLRRLGQVWKSWGGQWFESDNIHFQA